ncbi:DUF607-domain-containing protein [Mycena venus]|uniref:DUF607-domain-containing protein n=1 Tax=Mycena venus TaxID=2733690 RepID=A0A8H7CDT2_9AGAR|nr:DUF607-domain-containing protein [Mycena venus]
MDFWYPSSLEPAKVSAAMRFFDMEMGPHEALFSRIPARDLVQLMQTCRCVYFLIMETCFSLPRLLSPFFGDATKVQQFRQMQSRTGTIISGSTALQFFNRLTWTDSDLDIYVPRVSAALAVIFIMENGYTYNPRKSQDKNVSAQLSVSVSDRPPSYLGRGIADVLDFHKGERKIQVIVATTTPLEIILSFHSTCVMNIITHDNAFALYPRSTFITNEALVVETVGAGQEAGRQKYIDRGWQMIRSPSVDCRSELGVRLVRWVGDHFTWTIPLPPLPVETADTDLCPINSWRLDCDVHTTWTTWGVLTHPAFRYQYIIGDAGSLETVSANVLSVFESDADAELCRAIVLYREKKINQGLLPY